MNFSIGLTGLLAAQKAIELTGTNLANATTPGYHRQSLNLAPLELGGKTKAAIGGVEILGSTREYDVLLERETLRQEPILGENTEQLNALKAIEAVVGTIDADPLGQSLRDFFSALNDLASSPTELAFASDTIINAEAVTTNLHNISDFLQQMKVQVKEQAEQLIQEVNIQSESISYLNGQIELAIRRGTTPNLLKDQRDFAVQQLAGMADVYTTGLSSEDGQINVQAWGTPLVLGENYTRLSVGLTVEDKLGIGVEGMLSFDTTAEGGQVGGLMEMYNEIIPDLQTKIDTLARELANQFNAIHLQGVGSGGSFSELNGVAVDTTGPLEGWDPPIVDGEVFCIREITPAGQVTVHEVTVQNTDTLNDVITDINALSPGNIKAEIVNSALRIYTENNYQFDFLPDYSLDTSAMTGSKPAIEISGIYTGENQTYTFEISESAAGAGEVGITEGLTLTVKNGAGQIVKVLDVGQGYAEGDVLNVEQGLAISLSYGELNDGESFTIKARSETDPSGFLLSAGMNTFFKGLTAGDLTVRDEFKDDPMRLATAIGPDQNDNVNITRLAELSTASIDELGGNNPNGFYREFVSDVGQMVMVRESRQESLHAIQRELANRRDAVSGVDPNEEAASMLVYQRMFQAMSKFLTVQDESLQSLMNVL